MDRIDLPTREPPSLWLNRTSPFLVLTLEALSTWVHAVFEDETRLLPLAIPVVLGLLGIGVSFPADDEDDPERQAVVTQLRATLLSVIVMIWSLLFGFAPWYWLVPASAVISQTLNPFLVRNVRLLQIQAAAMVVGILLLGLSLPPLNLMNHGGAESLTPLLGVIGLWSTVYLGRRQVVKLASEKREELDQQMQTLLVRAERASETSQYIVSSVSHEMRTPLASVLGFSQMSRRILNESVIPAIKNNPSALRKARRAEENLKIVEIEARRMTSIVNVLLDHHDLTSGVAEWGDHPVPIRPVIIAALTDILKILPNPPPFKFKVEIPKELPPVNGDENRLRECIIEVLSNAVKFTPSGLISFSAGHGRGEVWVRVEDSGQGINAEHIDDIFIPFNQAKRLANTDKPEGTGLGLAFVKSVVEGHGGRVEVTSVAGEGSTFTIHLPIAASGPDALSSNPVQARGGTSSSSSGSQRRITRTTNPAAWAKPSPSAEASGGWDLPKIKRELASHHDVIILDSEYGVTGEAPLPPADARHGDEDTEDTEDTDHEEDVTDMPTFEFDASSPPVLVMDDSRALSDAWRQALIHSGVNALVVPPAQIITTTRFWLMQPSVLTLTVVFGDCDPSLEEAIVREFEDITEQEGRLSVISVSQLTSDIRRRSSAILLAYEKPISITELVRITKTGR